MHVVIQGFMVLGPRNGRILWQTLGKEPLSGQLFKLLRMHFNDTKATRSRLNEKLCAEKDGIKIEAWKDSQLTEKLITSKSIK